MDIELLVDAPAFWDRLRADLAGARRSAYLQTFSFEGDRVGTSLGRALERCAAPDRRLLVDGFSLLFHNDRLIPGPAWLDRSFRREVLLTHRWVRRLRDGGAGVRFGNPLGPSPVDLLRRSHKKLAVVDERVAYLGGINFSDHNFAWHDMMLRVEDPELGRLLAADFRASWEGRPRALDTRVGPLRIVSLNGRANPRGMRPVVEAVQGARHTIDVASAYLSHPFTRHLADARRRGVRVRVLTPAANNKGNLARHVLHTAWRHGFDVRRYAGGMSHLKAMLIDGEVLVAGSSNFDFMSYHILEELVVITRDPEVIRSFRRQVWEPDLAAALPGRVRASVGTRLGNAAVRAGAVVAGLLALTVLLLLLVPLAPGAAAAQTTAATPPASAPAPAAPSADRPAWAVDGMPDTVRVLVEASFAADDDDDRAKGLLRQAESRARAAVAEAPDDVPRRFALAVVLGLRADREGGRTKVNAASELHDQLVTILEREPEHARARHMLGRLHAGVRRMSSVVRWIATRLLGGEALASATWEEAERHLAFAEERAPEVPDHHLQLANLYRDTGRPGLALEEVEHVLALPATSAMELDVRAEALALKRRLAREGGEP